VKDIGKDENVREAIGIVDKLTKMEEKEYAESQAPEPEAPKKKPLYFRE